MSAKETNVLSSGVGLAVAALAALGPLASPPWSFWVEVGCLGVGATTVIIGGILGKGPPSADDWTPEVDGFREAAASLWATLVPLHERGGFFGMGSAPSGLEDLVRAVPWPDDKGEVEAISAAFRGALADFCRRACTKSREDLIGDTNEFFALDATRRRLTDTLRKWAKRVDVKGFLDWLRDADRLNWPRREAGAGPYSPLHARTLKLLWYMELAVAGDSGDDPTRCGFLATLRDRLSAPLLKAAAKNGYLTSSLPRG